MNISNDYIGYKTNRCFACEEKDKLIADLGNNIAYLKSIISSGDLRDGEVDKKTTGF